jgi:multidrug resistance protein
MREHRTLRPVLISGGTPLLLLVCLVILIDSLGYGVVVPVLPLYARQLGVSDFKLGLLFATYAIALLAGAIPAGMLSDRFGRKPFVLFGMFAMSGAFVFYAFAKSYPALVTARVLDGLTAAATWSAGLALIGDRFEEGTLGVKFGYALTAMAVGAVGGPVVGGILSDRVGYRAPFLFIAMLCLIGGVSALFLSEKRDRPRFKTRPGEMLRPILGNRVILLACAATAVTTVGLGMIEPLLPLRLSSVFKMSRTGIGLLFGVNLVFYGLASPLVGKYSDRVGRKAPMLIGLITTALLFPFLSVTRNLALMYVLIAFLGVTIAMFGTPSVPLITDALPAVDLGGQSSLYGTAFGLMNLSWSLGYAVGPLLGGAIVTISGLPAALIVYSCLLVLLTLVLVRYLR